MRIRARSACKLKGLETNQLADVGVGAGDDAYSLYVYRCTDFPAWV